MSFILKYSRVVKNNSIECDCFLEDELRLRNSLKFSVLNTSGSPEKILSVILMNPSFANKYGSDKTINNLARYIVNFFPDFSSVQVYNLIPIFCNDSTKLIDYLKKFNPEKLNKILNDNLELIKCSIHNSQDVIIGWGDRPKTITKKDSSFIFNIFDENVENIKTLLIEKNLYFLYDEDSHLGYLTNIGNPRHPWNQNYYSNSHSMCSISKSLKIIHTIHTD